MDGDMTIIDNEDWMKTLTWDMHRGATLITTIEDLLWALRASDMELDQQKSAVLRFTNLPTWKVAPGELVVVVADFLTSTDDSVKAKASRVLAAMRPPTVGHRHPTKIELASKTDFEVMQKTWTTNLDGLLAQWDVVRTKQTDELQQQISDAVDNGDVDALASIMVDTTGSDLILAHMNTMLEDSIVQAKAEAAAQGITMQTLDTTGVVKTMQKQADAVAQVMARSFSNTAATQGLTRYGVDSLSGSDVASAVGDHLAALSPAYLSDMLGGALTQAQNQGRMLVFQQAPGTYHSSELLDQNTCEPCASVDGTDYDSLDDAESDYPTGGYAECAGGPRCRGTIVVVYDEATTPQDDSDSTDDTSTDGS
jgi:hypothetical protein